MRYLVFVCLLLAAVSSHASSNRSSDHCVDQVCSRLSVFECDQTRELEEIARTCSLYDTGGLGCFNFLMESAGPFDQNQWRKVKPYLMACSENWGSACVEIFYERLGLLSMNQTRERLKAAQVCKLVDASCVSSVCDRLGAFGCNTFRKLEKVARSCQAW